FPGLPESRRATIHSATIEARDRAKEYCAKNGKQFFEYTAAQGMPEMPLNSVAMQDPEEQSERLIASEQLRYSLAGRMGHVLEPAIRPLGFDWKMGVGLVGAFAAREVFVSTMAIVYNAGSEDDTTDLASAMRNDTR